MRRSRKYALNVQLMTTSRVPWTSHSNVLRQPNLDIRCTCHLVRIGPTIINYSLIIRKLLKIHGSSGTDVYIKSYSNVQTKQLRCIKIPEVHYVICMSDLAVPRMFSRDVSWTFDTVHPMFNVAQALYEHTFWTFIKSMRCT